MATPATHGGLVGDVQDDGGEAVGGVAGLGDGVLESVLADVGGDDPAAFGEHAQDGGLADAGATAGDERAASFVTGQLVHGGNLSMSSFRESCFRDV